MRRVRVENGTVSEEPPTRFDRKLAAIFAADVEAYSQLMRADEVATLRALTASRDIMDRLIASHRGRIANTAGDSVLAEFPSVVEAVQCAVEIQRTLAEAEEPLPPARQLRFRIGVHVGDVMVKAGDLFGDGVNIAARLQGLAPAGGICVSGAAYDYVRKALPLTFRDLGPQTVKNIDEPIHAYEIGTVTGEAARPPADAKSLPLPDKPSIAVLPFNNMSGDPEQDYFADGLVEDIITALSRFDRLFVIARNSSFTYKGHAIDVKQVGRELGVRYVLEGSVRKAGGRVRITGQLIDAATGAHLWAERFDGALADIFDLQDEMTASVVGAISPKLMQAEIERAKHKPTENLDAYDLYLKALVPTRATTKAGNDEALELCYGAIAADPDFAAPYGLAAAQLAIRKTNGWSLDPAQEQAETARLVERAVALGDEDANSLAMAAVALAFMLFDLDRAEALNERALALNPHLALSWQMKGWLSIWLGQPEAAIQSAERAERLSPRDPLLFHVHSVMALAHFLAGRDVEAVSWAIKALGQNANWLPALQVAAAGNAMAGRAAEAAKALALLRQMNPELRLSRFAQNGPFRRPQDLERLVEGLRKAGLPE